jgi:hypothetical protein
MHNVTTLSEIENNVLMNIQLTGDYKSATIIKASGFLYS